MRPALLLLCLCSGACGLVYEVVWARELSLLIGHAAGAQAAVLALFLGGLALGNARLGTRADRARDPLVFYGLLELGIGLLGLVSPLVFLAAGSSLVWERLGLAVGCALVVGTAALMGGAIPALLLALASRGEEPEKALPRLYSINCAGAVLGALAAGFVLVPVWGLSAAALAAAALNAGNGFCALWLARRSFVGPAQARASGARLPGASSPARSAAPPEPDASPSHAASTRMAVLVCAFLSGYAALGYEIAWTRLLALVMGSSAYSFCVMLAAFIAGIALGGWLVSLRALRRQDGALLFGLAQLGAAASIWATLPFYERLPLYFRTLSEAMDANGVSFHQFEALKFLFCFSLMLLPATFLGMALPLAARLAAPKPGELAGGVGRVFAANTWGNVLGAAAGIWLLPRLSFDGVIRAGTLINLLAGAAFLPWTVKRRAAVAAAGLLAYGLTPRLDKLHFSLGAFQRRQEGVNPRTWKEYRESLFKDRALLYYKDDPNAAVSIIRYRDGILSLHVNGKADASTGGDVLTQVLLAHIPLLLRPQAQRVLVVGWGSGMTAGSALRHPVRRLDAVEIAPAVVDASRYFNSANGRPREDSRLSLHLADAKAFLRRSPASYDVIISEPSNPWMAGIGGLFSSEFYAQARRRLRPGGLMVQWFHLYYMDDETLRLVLRTLLAEFRHVSLWSVMGSDVILVASQEETEPDFRLMERAFSRPEVRQDLKRAGVSELATALSLQMASGEAVRRLAGAGALNSDRLPLLEHRAPKAHFLDSYAGLVYDHDLRSSAAGREGLYLARYLRERGRALQGAEYLDILAFPHSSSEEEAFAPLLDEWRRRHPKDPMAWLALAVVEKEDDNLPAARAALRRAKALSPRHPKVKELAAELGL